MAKKEKVYAQNRKASFDYEIIDRFEAGIILSGHETKAIKDGKAILTGAFVIFQKDRPVLLNATIKPYQANNTPEGYEENRTIELLLSKKEIKKLLAEKEGSNLTIIPLSLYNKKNLVKLEIALARRKKKVDKRESIKKQDIERRMRRVKK